MRQTPPGVGCVVRGTSTSACRDVEAMGRMLSGSNLMGGVCVLMPMLREFMQTRLSLVGGAERRVTAKGAPLAGKDALSCLDDALGACALHDLVRDRLELG